jgi:flavodoxin
MAVSANTYLAAMAISDLSRRAALASPAALLLGSAACAQTRPEGTALVAYFTRSGNTRVIAGLLQRDLGATLFEIRAAEPYPEDYEATVAQAKRERDSRFEPVLASKTLELSGVDAVYLGFPIWGETAPPVIRSFLSAHDLSGKALHPFITHGGYGPGSSLAVLKAGAPHASLRDAFILEADQERRTIGQVRSWLSAQT